MQWQGKRSRFVLAGQWLLCLHGSARLEVASRLIGCDEALDSGRGGDDYSGGHEEDCLVVAFGRIYVEGAAEGVYDSKLHGLHALRGIGQLGRILRLGNSIRVFLHAATARH